MLIVIYTNRELELLGAALYLGEGTKARKTNKGYIYAIEFTNTDPRMIGVFMDFLRNVIHPVEERVKAQLFVYPDHNEEILKKKWEAITGIPKGRFQKSIMLRQSSGRFRPSELGIMKVRYNHKEHFLKLQGIINEVFGGVA